jgi:hypothetical protein
MLLIITIIDMNEYTTISVKPKTLDALAELCKKTQSYDKLIQELIQCWRKSHCQ